MVVMLGFRDQVKKVFYLHEHISFHYIKGWKYQYFLPLSAFTNGEILLICEISGLLWYVDKHDFKWTELTVDYLIMVTAIP